MTEQTEHPVDFLPELALGALPEVEAARLRSHVDDCASCMREYLQMLDVARVLPLAGEDVNVSPSVRDGVMGRIEREPRPIGQNRRAGWYWRPAALAAGIGLLIAAGIGGGFAIGHSKDGNVGNAAQEGLVAALVQGTARTNHVQAGSLQMTFVHAPGADSGYVSAENLPPLPAGKAYEAWFSKDGTHMEASTVFTSDGGTWVEAPGPISHYVAMGFTIEDASGAQAPTTAPFALISLSETAYNYPG